MHTTTLKQATQNNLLTRRQVADVLNIDLSTVHNWTKQGILIAYRLGGRVYYKFTDIENNLQRVANLNDGRGE